MRIHLFSEYKSRSKSLECSIFCLVTSLSLLFYGGHSTSIDEETYLASLRSLLHGRSYIDFSTVTPESVLTTPGRSGLPTSFYGIGTSIFFLPAYLSGRLVAFFVQPPFQEMVVRLFLYTTNSICLGLTALVIYKFCWQQGCSQIVSLWASLSFSFCTYAFATAGTGFSEPLTALFLISAVYFMMFEQMTFRHGYFCGLSLGCAILMRASAILFVPIFLIFLLLSKRLRSQPSHLIATALGGLAPGLLFLIVNYWRYGSILETGYPKLPYTTPVLEGLFGLFLSSGKGLFWFAPIVLIACSFVINAWRSKPHLTILLWAIIVCNALFFSRFEIWSGDDAFGPRYMGVVLPLFAVLSALGIQNRNMFAPLLASLFGLPASIGGSLIYVNASNSSRANSLITAVGESAKNSDGTINWSEVRQLTWFTPRYSQLSIHISQIDDAIKNSLAALKNPDIPPFLDGNASALSWYMKSVRLDVWWSYWLQSGAPRFFLLAVPVLLIIAALCSRDIYKIAKMNQLNEIDSI